MREMDSFGLPRRPSAKRFLSWAAARDSIIDAWLGNDLFRGRFSEVSWNWRGEAELLVGSRMAKREFPGVEHLTWRISGAFAAVDFVAEHGMTEVMEMDADLMGATGVDRTFDEAAIAARAQDPVFGFRGTAGSLSDTHSVTVNRMAGDRRVDRAN